RVQVQILKLRNDAETPSSHGGDRAGQRAINYVKPDEQLWPTAINPVWLAGLLQLPTDKGKAARDPVDYQRDNHSNSHQLWEDLQIVKHRLCPFEQLVNLNQ